MRISAQRSLLVSVLFGLTGTLSLGGAAQTDTCSRRTILVSAANRDWAPILALQPADFLGEYQGKPIRIVSVSADEAPRRIVILLDISGSLGGQQLKGPGAWRLGLALASNFAQAKLENTELALIIFNEKIREKMDFDSGREKIVERLRQIGSDPNYEKKNVKGKTALRDAAVTALELLGQQNQNGAIYAITDGGDNASAVKEGELRHRLTQSGVRFFVSVVTSPSGNNNRTPEELQGSDTIPEFARSNSGAMFGPVIQAGSGIAVVGLDSTRNLKISDVLSNFYRTIQDGYRIEIESPRAQDKWSSLKLDLSKPSRSRFKGYQLGFTRDISPCEAHSD